MSCEQFFICATHIICASGALCKLCKLAAVAVWEAGAAQAQNSPVLVAQVLSARQRLVPVHVRMCASTRPPCVCKR